MTRSRITLATIALAAAFALSATPIAQVRPEVALRTAIELEESKGNVKGAIDEYKKLAESRDRAVAAQALLRLADAYQKLGDGEARKIYERLVRDFGDQAEANATARTRLQVFPSPGGTRDQSARRIWAGAAWGRLSSDGRYLTHGASSGDLVLADVTTKTTRRLTNTGGWVVSGDYLDDSVISPDGRQVAYTWFIEAENRYELRVISTATPDARPRTLMRPPMGEWVGPAAWTPDGTRLIVAREPDRGIWQLGIVSMTDGSYRSLKSLEWRNPGRQSMSPDGRFIAYEGRFPDTGSPRDILVLALDGSRETAAVTGPADDFSPLWSPDGSHLVFMSTRSGSNGLWAVPMREGQASGPAVLLKADVGAINPMGITRGGSLYYMAAGNARQDVFVAPLEGYQVTKMPTRVGDQFVNANTGPAWSPDGETLAYYSMRGASIERMRVDGGRPTLVLRSVKTGQERTFSMPQALLNPFLSGPRWFPNGRSLLILARNLEGTSVAFFRFDIETGNSAPLHQVDGNPSSFVLAPDGTAIFWTAPNTGRLMRFDISTGQEVELKRDAPVITVAVSPDGRQLAYLRSYDRRGNHTEAPSAVEVIPSGGGEARQLLRDPIWLGGNRFNTLAWTPDQKNLIVMRDDGVLWRVPLDGAMPQTMNLLSDGGFWRPEGSVTPKVGISITGRFKSPAIHPDGKTIAFSLAQSDPGEIWALDNFLPSASAKK
jgi:Tol biopolymer transport system component